MSILSYSMSYFKQEILLSKLHYTCMVSLTSVFMKITFEKSRFLDKAPGAKLNFCP